MLNSIPRPTTLEGQGIYPIPGHAELSADLLLVKFAASLLENLLIRLGRALFAGPITQGT